MIIEQILEKNNLKYYKLKHKPDGFQKVDSIQDITIYKNGKHFLLEQGNSYYKITNNKEIINFLFDYFTSVIFLSDKNH